MSAAVSTDFSEHISSDASSLPQGRASVPRLRLATRRSRLALAQAEWVAGRLRAAWPELQVELVPLVTTGDRTQDRDLLPAIGKGLFTREVEEALFDGRADLAVHSAKDLPTELPHGLDLLCVPVRADPRDCVVGLPLAALPSGATVGTGSTRREAQLLALRPDLRVAPLRGNVDTRVRKAQSGDTFAAVVLAVAGLERLGLAAAIAEILDPDVFLPAPGQGALALEGRTGDEVVQRLTAPLADPAALAAVVAERAFLSALGGGCAAPIAALGRAVGGQLDLAGLNALGGDLRRGALSGPTERAAEIGAQLAERLSR